MKQRTDKLIRDDFLLHTGIMIVGTKLGDLFNFIYRLAMVRLLTVEEYGILNSLISFSLIFYQFVAPFQPALTKYIASYSARGDWARVRFLVGRAWRDLGIFSVVVFIISITISGGVGDYLKIGESSHIILAGLMIAFSILLAVPMAFIQGTQLFIPLAYLSALSAFFKMLIGVGLILLARRFSISNLTVNGALLGMIASPLSIILIGRFIIKKHLNRHSGEIGSESTSMRPIYKYFIPTALILGSFWTLTNVDVIMVKHFFSSEQAGLYSIAQMVGLIILFLPGAITLVIFPKAASAHAQNTGSRAILWKGLAIVALLCLVGTVICGVLPGPILTAVSGKNNPQSRELILWFSLAMSFYALTMLAVYYHLAVHNIKIALPLVLLAVSEIGMISLYHPTLKSVIYIVLGYSIVTFIVSLFMLRYTPNIGQPFPDKKILQRGGG